MAGINSNRALPAIIGWLLLATLVHGQEVAVQRVDPPSWWTGFKNTELQLLVYGKNISTTDVRIDYPGVRLIKIHKAESPNYLFIDLSVAPETKPGKFDLSFRTGRTVVATYSYQLLARRKSSSQREGFNSSDVIYLLVPDRFANGD